MFVVAILAGIVSVLLLGIAFFGSLSVFYKIKEEIGEEVNWIKPELLSGIVVLLILLFGIPIVYL